MPVFIKGAGKSPKGTATAANVLAGKTFSNDSDVGLTGTMIDRGAVAISPGTSQQTINVGYHNGSGYVDGDADLVAGNIKNGVNIFGVTGNVVESKQRSGSVYVNNGEIVDVVAGISVLSCMVYPSANTYAKSIYAFGNSLTSPNSGAVTVTVSGSTITITNYSGQGSTVYWQAVGY